MVTHSLTMLEKHLVFPGETPPRNFTTNRVKKRSIKSDQDPLSHRIIEKRRRDRMNNCLADLSRLIPPEYLKKGRGRIEKTEIIEMAIKHIGHLQNVIASTKFNENSNSSAPSPPAPSAISRDQPTSPVNQPLTVKHYRMGYLECMSEVMHFLVEVQGYFAGDSICVQMINHLQKHCDKMLKGDALNLQPKKHEAVSRESSNSPSNVQYNRSPPLGMSNSAGSTSDDYQINQINFELRSVDGYCSPKRFSDVCCNSKVRSSDGCCPRFVDSSGMDNENQLDSDSHKNLVLKCPVKELRKEESNVHYESGGMCQKKYQMCQKFSQTGEFGNCESFSVKDENSSSQLREMLTSPISLSTSTNDQANRYATETKGNVSPMSNVSGYEGHINGMSTCGGKDGDHHSEVRQQGTHHSDHVMMYKFKNNIKQRFSKERQESGESESNEEQLRAPKKQKADEYHRYQESLMKERLSLLDRTDSQREEEDDKLLKFTGDTCGKKRYRYGSESETQIGSDLSNRLNFGHRTSEKGKHWDESAVLGFHFQGGHKLWSPSPSASLPFYASFSTGCKPSLGEYQAEFASVVSSSFNGLSITTTSESGPGIPIFALHAKGSFYIPLTLNQTALAPFLSVLGLTKSEEDGVEEKTVLHPVTISVNFHSQVVR